MIRFFCCSDIHSFFDVWMLALNNKGFDINNSDDKLIICGDLFDRGNESVKCYEFVKRLSEEGRLIYIRGNHEDLLLDCIDELKKEKLVSSHHISNGTVRTLANFLNCSETAILYYAFDSEKFRNVSEELTNFINKNTLDYFQLADKVFVHSWVPFKEHSNGVIYVDKDWRTSSWAKARWVCGYDFWQQNIFPQDISTIVFGHWHTSYAWHTFRGKSEWGEDAVFEPFIADGIIGIDTCTAYTNKVNVVVFDGRGNIIG